MKEQPHGALLPAGLKPPHLLTTKLVRYGLDKWTMQWVETGWTADDREPVASLRDQDWHEDGLMSSSMTRMIKRCLLSTDLWMTPNWEEWSIHWRERLLFRGTWRNGPQEPGEVQQEKIQSCFWDRITPCNNTGWA